jgi:outer membrane protein TolC
MRTAVILAPAALALLLASCAAWDPAAPPLPVAPAKGAAAAARPGAPAGVPAVPETGPVRLTLEGAVLLALAGNREFAIQRVNPALDALAEDAARAAFDPRVRSGITARRSISGPTAASPPGTGSSGTTGWTLTGAADLPLPTGTTVSVDATESWTDSSAGDPGFASGAGLTVTQALLQGAGLSVNLASLRQARLDTESSAYELRGAAEALVANVEKACWDYVQASRQIAIVEDSLRLAERSLADVSERILVGKIAEVERFAAQTEAALRREDLINARSALAKAAVRMVRLLNLPGKDRWTRPLSVAAEPAAPEERLDLVEKHVELALRLRSDLNQARLSVLRGEIEIVRTENGLLPRLDVFLSLGATGYARSFGRSLEDLSGENLEASAGLSLDWPPVRRDGRARHRQALLRLDQTRESLRNMAELVESDVRTAHIEAERTREQIAATRATRVLKEQSLRAESEKFQVGKSTSFLVAQAQRDLMASRISEAQAATNHLKALVDLYRLEGSLLERRGIDAPGRNPVALPDDAAGEAK